jgi:hypothetical protein
MSSKWMLVFTSIFSFLCAAQARSEDSASSVKIEKVSVTPVAGGLYEIKLEATITLGSGDSFVGDRCWYTNPDNKDVTPEVHFVPPQTGKSSTLTAWRTVGAKGNWKGNFRWLYKGADGKEKELVVSKEFAIP